MHYEIETPGPGVPNALSANESEFPPSMPVKVVRPLLKLINDPSDQEVAGEPHGRRHAMKPPPLPAQLEDGHLREPHERLCDIDRCFVHVSECAAFRCGSVERRRWASMM